MQYYAHELDWCHAKSLEQEYLKEKESGSNRFQAIT